MQKFNLTVTTELLCTFIIISLLTWYLYYLYCFTYWKKKGVPTTTPYFPAGNILKAILGQENLFHAVANYYKEFKSKGYKHAGLYFFNGPVYLPIDQELIKRILITDFEYFVDRGAFVDEKNAPMSAHLFSLEGEKWRSLRNKLSPTFSSGKLKTMYEIFMKTTENFIDTVALRASEDEEVNIKKISTNFTADIIFSTAFGLEAGTLKDPNNEISKTALNLFHVPTWRFLIFLFLDGLQNPGNMFKGIISNKKHEYILSRILKEAIQYRDEKSVIRKDFLSLLLEIRDKQGITFNEMLAQSFLFFLAGFETSSQTISYCIHELAHNQEFQDKLRNEIFDNLGKDFTKYTYEDVLKLPYLDRVANETLRKYPVLGFYNRICVKPYQVPGTNVVIEKGTPVLIPTLGIHQDPEYYPDPLKFDPDRFNGDQVYPPCSFMPFGEGPRICIGMRYGKLQTKLGIAALISRFKFSPSSVTPRHIELDKFCKAVVMVPSDGINVKIKSL